MLVRTKIAILSALLLVALALVVGATLLTVVRPAFLDLEEQITRERMATVTGSLDAERDSLDRLAHDWASWTDTYTYIADRNEDYEASNLVDSTFIDGVLHIFALIDTRGRPVWTVAWSADFDERQPLPEIEEGLSPTHPLMAALTTGDGVRGLMATGRGPLLVSSRPVLTSAEEGPPRGILIMGRFLRYVLDTHVEPATNVSARLWTSNENDTKQPEEVAALLAGRGDPVRVAALGGDQDAVLVWTRLDGLDGAPLAVISSRFAKLVEPAGERAVATAGLAAAGGGLVIVLIFWLVARSTVAAPLRALEEHITRLTDTGDMESRLAVGRNDEIGSLARAFDTLQGRLTRLAHYDTLTDLPNRTLFELLAGAILAQSERDGRKAVVVVVDLDRFKAINESVGRAEGDLLLREVAKRLTELHGPADVLARFGGDEFVVLMGGLDGNTGQLQDAVDRLRRAFDAPFDLSKGPTYVEASFGVALFPDDSRTLDTLLGQADAAMNHTKAMGGNALQFFDGVISERARELLSLEHSLREALVKDAMSLLWQPQVDGRTNRVVGFEALVRWQHPVRGAISAEEFMPFAEQSGLHDALDRWVLKAACLQARQWQDAFAEVPRLSINISARHFETGRLVPLVRGVIRDTGVRPELLALEITEGTMMRPTDETIAALRELRGLGVGILIDDFGTGFASLSYLRKFPIDGIKMDKTFIAELPANTDDTAILRSMVALAAELKLSVIAEGVERPDQAAWLTQAGCHLHQGYLYSRPLDWIAATAELQNLRARGVGEGGEVSGM